MKPQLIEHLLLPSVYLSDPVFRIELIVDGTLKKTFGVYFANIKEFEDGILFRACILMGCSMMSEELERCQGRISFEGQEWIFAYNSDINYYQLQ